jgi:F-type H+-transporting ATPase subunit b
MGLELWRQIGETITQAITFLIFLWIMKRFAWPALMSVLDERQRRITEGFQEIERKQAEVGRLVAEHDARMKGVEEEARARIQEAVADGRRVSAELIENARDEAAKITERAQRNVQLEIAKARIELRDEVIAMAIGAAERLMRERLDEEANRRLVAAFIQDLESGGGREKA